MAKKIIKQKEITEQEVVQVAELAPVLVETKEEEIKFIPLDKKPLKPIVQDVTIAKQIPNNTFVSKAFESNVNYVYLLDKKRGTKEAFLPDTANYLLKNHSENYIKI